MLINFVGSPCSGKTTTAARLFAQLKQDSFIAEFIPEQARHYIAEAKYRNLDPLAPPFALTDDDQVSIMCRQNDMEKIMLHSVGTEGVVVSDSSVLNTLLYLSEEKLASKGVQMLVAEAVTRIGLLFVCPPVKAPTHSDPNRVHSPSQIEEIDRKVPSILEKYASTIPTIHLSGSPHLRYALALEEAYTRTFDC